MKVQDLGMPCSRREMLQRIGAGFGTLGLTGMCAESSRLGSSAQAATVGASPWDAQAPHFTPTAKHVIQLFMPGGPSHIDTFDYKPDIKKYAGQRPKLVDRKTLSNTEEGLLPSHFRFQQHGECGKWVSSIFPHIAKVVDDICFIHSMHTDIPEHAGAILMMNLGHLQPTRPSLGSWLVYGLGTMTENLPGFVAISPRDPPRGKAANWGNAFLPGAYAGCYVQTGKMHPDNIVANLKSQFLPRVAQREQADLLAQLNQLHLNRQQQNADLEASIQAMELAFRMQFAVPEAFDLSRETKATHDLYGDGEYGQACLLARRLVQRGVRTVQLSTSNIDHAEGIGWDSGHKNITKHAGLAKACDQAIAALLVDLKQRGMLDETLVIWAGEFGRAPTSEKKTGRDHNHYGFTVWMAGGGVRGGISYGATDCFGCTAVENPVHIHDLHATILHLMGLDHERLIYRYSGRDFRLTDVHGKVIKEIIA